MNEFKQLTEEEFYAMFIPQINHFERAIADASIADEDICSFNGCLYETYSPDIDYVIEMSKLNRVVTIIEGDTEEAAEGGEIMTGCYYTSGYRLFNRLGFLILDKPYEFEFEVKID
jgi:hypothetical protein